MHEKDLTVIGRLGGLDSEGYFHLMIKPEYRDLPDELDEVYLIFNSDRVFYVSISDTKLTDKKQWIRFKEDGVIEERRLHKEALVAIDPEILDNQAEELDIYLEAPVIYQGKPIGSLRSFFYNGAQYVLEIEMEDGRELLVPLVDYYLVSLCQEPPQIELQNLQSLLDNLDE